MNPSSRSLTLRRALHAGAALTLSLVAASCAPPKSAHDAQRDNPLGPSFWIIPVPSDDDSLLTRVFAAPPDPSKTLEEQSAPNPCAEHLAERRDASMPNHFENAIDTRTTAKAGAILSMYGFSADVSHATHLLYKLDTTTKASRMDTAEYIQCCAEKGCGWGYVSALVLGEGEYASATEAAVELGGTYSVVSAGVSRSFAVANKRSVKGYIAAIIVEHKRGDAAKDCPAGEVWAKIECVPEGMPAEQEQLCKEGNPQASDPEWAGNETMQATFKQQQDDACRWLAAHGGPGAGGAPPPAEVAPGEPDPAAPPAPAAPPPPAPFAPGDYVAISSFWSGKMTFKADGTFVRDNGDKGVWLEDGDTLIVRWDSGDEEKLTRSGPDAYQNATGFFKLKRTAASDAPVEPKPKKKKAPADGAAPAESPAPSAPTDTPPATE